MTNLQDQMQRARELLGNVTGGPWEFRNFYDSGVAKFSRIEPESSRSSTMLYEEIAIIPHDDDITEDGEKEMLANAQFIALSRTLLPALMDEVERLEVQAANAETRSKLWKSRADIVEELETKLARAVEGLEFIFDNQLDTNDHCQWCDNEMDSEASDGGHIHLCPALVAEQTLREIEVM